MPGLESPVHLLILLVIILVIFGPGRLPEMGTGLGRAIRGFREAASGREPIQAEPKKEGEVTAGKNDVKP